MPKCEDLLLAARNNPKGVRFRDLVSLAVCYGFQERRQKGSHVIMSRPGLRRPIPLQDTKDGKAKPSQVKQILAVIDQDQANDQFEE